MARVLQLHWFLVTRSASFGVAILRGVQFSTPQIAVAPQTSACLETDVASPFPSHEVATAYSLGHWPEVTVVPLSVSFFPA